MGGAVPEGRRPGEGPRAHRLPELVDIDARLQSPVGEVRPVVGDAEAVPALRAFLRDKLEVLLLCEELFRDPLDR